MSKHEDQKTQAAPAAAAPKSEAENVTMTDGRVVAFPGKRKLIKTIAEDNKTIRFDFRNGETRTYSLPHSGEMLHRLAAHGAAQKIGDETAGTEDVADQVVAVEAMIDRLGKGEWGATRSAGDSYRGASIVIRAVCEATGKSVEEVKKFIEDKLAKTEGLTRAALYASFRSPNSKTGQIIARLESEKASKKAPAVSSDDLLAEIG